MIIKVSINMCGRLTVIAGVYAMNDNATYEEKDFFGKLSDILGNIGPQYKAILTGDFNSRVGNKDEDAVGRSGEETINNNGSRLINVCKKYNGMSIYSTCKKTDGLKEYCSGPQYEKEEEADPH
jgi:hypothetical protein